MKTLMRGLLNLSEKAIQLLCESGAKCYELLQDCRKQSKAVAGAIYEPNYDEQRKELTVKYDRYNEACADRAAIVENMKDAVILARKEAETILENQLSTDAAKVDGVVLELLKNELYTDQELKTEAEKFKENPTMLRLIGKYAAKRAGADMQSLAAEIERKRDSHVLELFDEFKKICEKAVRRAYAWREDSPAADEQIKALKTDASPLIDQAVFAMKEYQK